MIRNNARVDSHSTKDGGKSGGAIDRRCTATEVRNEICRVFARADPVDLDPLSLLDVSEPSLEERQQVLLEQLRARPALLRVWLALEDRVDLQPGDVGERRARGEHLGVGRHHAVGRQAAHHFELDAAVHEQLAFHDMLRLGIVRGSGGSDGARRAAGRGGGARAREEAGPAPAIHGRTYSRKSSSELGIFGSISLVSELSTRGSVASTGSTCILTSAARPTG